MIVLVAVIGWFWQDSLRVRDRANGAAIEACARLALQFLDGTVAFSHLRLVRDAGQLRLRRTYVFDYTAHSIERLQGFVVLLGMRVESVGFARGESSRSPTTVHTVTPAVSPTISPAVFQANVVAEQPPTAASPTTPSSGKVLDLDDWRRNHPLH
jgi:hypothetical protein